MKIERITPGEAARRPGGRVWWNEHRPLEGPLRQPDADDRTGRTPPASSPSPPGSHPDPSVTGSPVAAHHTDEALAAKRARGEELGLRGLVREADYLLLIAPELRAAAASDAREMTNRVPGYTYCDALSVVIERDQYLPHRPQP
jgi:hypothetical protein